MRYEKDFGSYIREGVQNIQFSFPIVYEILRGARDEAEAICEISIRIARGRMRISPPHEVLEMHSDGVRYWNQRLDLSFGWYREEDSWIFWIEIEPGPPPPGWEIPGWMG